MDAEGLAKLRSLAERVRLDDRPLLECPTELGDIERCGIAGWKLMACLVSGDYSLTDHLKSGDLAAVVFPMSIFRPPTGDRPAILGWIGSGSNRFRVDEVVDIDGVYFHVGVVEAGGFHSSKVNTAMWRSKADES